MGAALEEDTKKQQAEANPKNPENHRVMSLRRVCTVVQIVLRYNYFVTRQTPTSLSLRLGAKIAKLRRAKGLTQGRVEELIGLQPGHLSRIEHGFILPGLEVLAAIAKVFEITLPRLVSGIVEDEE
jgi:DNA-binding XRE family transcriptional regulator